MFLKAKLRLIFGSLDIGNRLRQKQILSLIRHFHPSFKSILDAGCGGGVCALRLAHRYPGSQLVGLDYDIYNVKQAQTDQKVLKIKNVEFRHGDLRTSLGENKYDLIYCIDVLEHINSDEKVLYNFFAALKQNGNLIIHVPLLNQRRVFKCFNDWSQADHVRDGYEKESLVKMLERQGFAVIYRKYTFGWVGALAWELDEIFRGLSSVARVMAFPALALLGGLDLRLRSDWGNGILIFATKEFQRTT